MEIELVNDLGEPGREGNWNLENDSDEGDRRDVGVADRIDGVDGVTGAGGRSCRTAIRVKCRFFRTSLSEI